MASDSILMIMAFCIAILCLIVGFLIFYILLQRRKIRLETLSHLRRCSNTYNVENNSARQYNTIERPRQKAVTFESDEEVELRRKELLPSTDQNLYNDYNLNYGQDVVDLSAVLRHSEYQTFSDPNLNAIYRQSSILHDILPSYNVQRSLLGCAHYLNSDFIIINPRRTVAIYENSRNTRNRQTPMYTSTMQFYLSPDRKAVEDDESSEETHGPPPLPERQPPHRYRSDRSNSNSSHKQS